MGRSLGCLLLVVVAAPLAVRAQPPAAGGGIVVTQSFNLSDPPEGMSGKHVLRFPTPDPKALAALRVGNTLTLLAVDVTGSTSVQGNESWYDGSSWHKCPGSFAADLSQEKNRRPALWIERTSTGFRLRTSMWSEYFTPHFASCGGEITGACEQAWETDVDFVVSEADVQRLERVKGTFQRKLEWTEENSCGGTLSASLNGDLGLDQEVTAEGPAYACGDQPLSFTATAKSPGGAFSQWEVKPSEGAPRVIQNTGGAAAKLVLSGDARKTGAATVTAVYRKQGKELRSEPRTVHFCTVEKPELRPGPAGRDGEHYQFDSGSPATLEIQAEGKAWRDGKEISDRLLWRGGANDGRSLTPDPAQGGRVKLKLEGLPETNDGFGPASVSSSLEEPECACQGEEKTAKLYFARDAKNNPGGDLPNWAFYWKQTKANPGVDFKVVPVLPPTPRAINAFWGVNCLPGIFEEGIVPASVFGRYEFVSDNVYLLERFSDGCPPRAPGVDKVDRGIDCFAVVLRHEGRHREELTAWWGKGLANYRCLKDTDGDMVPNEVEAARGCDPYGQQSCPGLPIWLGPMTDREASAYAAGWQWQPGTAKGEDWAAPGSQWPDGN